MKADSFGMTDPCATPIADLLGRMAQELHGLTQVVDDLQLLVGRLVSAGAIHEGDAMHELQNFDRLGQTLSGVASFAEALGHAADADWRLDPHSASRAVALRELAARLMSRGDEALASQSPRLSPGAGELELF
jgi:hypothetical protein